MRAARACDSPLLETTRALWRAESVAVPDNVSQPLLGPTAAPERNYGLHNATDFFFQFWGRERSFLTVLALGFLAAGMFYPNAEVARWLGFLFAGYAVVANDSIQTIGTFIASNGRRPWWALWLFIGGIFVATVGFSFWVNSGDVTFQRLAAKGFEQTPQSFSFLQVAAPLFLMVLTRLKMPVSTTFLLLTSFATSVESVGQVLSKSLCGYVIAFVLSFGLWMAASRALHRWYQKPATKLWSVAQWVTSGFLWSVWIMQDASNVAVYLPRALNWVEFVAFATVIFVGLGVLFYMRGERIQQVVNEKSDVVDVRAATLIDLLYAIILFAFKSWSRIPMSTTWVFIGLLAGRELAMSLRGVANGGVRAAGRMLMKDAAYVAIGLVLSIVIAASVNEPFREALLGR